MAAHDALIEQETYKAVLPLDIEVGDRTFEQLVSDYGAKQNGVPIYRSMLDLSFEMVTTIYPARLEAMYWEHLSCT